MPPCSGPTVVAHAHAYLRSDTSSPQRLYGPEEKLWQVNKTGKPVGKMEGGLAY